MIGSIKPRYSINFITAPDGVQPPNLVSQSSSSITATWTSVGRENAKDAPVYILQFRNRNNSTLIYE